MIEKVPSPGSGVGPWEAAVIAQIAAEREARRLPKNELAQSVGIHPGSMSRYMKGERHLTLGMVERFAVALGIDLATLLRRAEERQRESGRRHLKIAGSDLQDAETDTTDGE